MLLSELFTNLSYGELSNLSIGGEGSGTIPDAHKARLLGYVNQSLTSIYSRFMLRENEVVVAAYDHITLYPLKKKFAVQDETVLAEGEVKFIEDTSFAPFEEDVVKVLGIYNEEGVEEALNDPLNEHSFYTPATGMDVTIQMPFPQEGNSYFVIYHATHPKLVIGEGGAIDLSQQILLPSVLESALQKRVAWHVFSPMNGAEHVSRAQEHLANFEMICFDAEQRDLVSTSRTQVNAKLHDRGWI